MLLYRLLPSCPMQSPQTVEQPGSQLGGSMRPRLKHSCTLRLSQPPRSARACACLAALPVADASAEQQETRDSAAELQDHSAEHSSAAQLDPPLDPEPPQFLLDRWIDEVHVLCGASVLSLWQGSCAGGSEVPAVRRPAAPHAQAARGHRRSSRRSHQGDGAPALQSCRQSPCSGLAARAFGG
jgi:hypothetical protein